MSTKKTKEPTKAAKTARRQGSKRQPAKGRRFTLAEKVRALTLVVAGMKRAQVAETVGTTTESLRRWVAQAEADGTMPKPPGETQQRATEEVSGPVVITPSESAWHAEKKGRSEYAPKDPGQGLSPQEEAAIPEHKKAPPLDGAGSRAAEAVQALAAQRQGDRAGVARARLRAGPSPWPPGRSAAGSLRGAAPQRALAARLL
ncbi:MAG TPA: transposase [Sandaracinaceae bacterium LLY-WYZ-13_1]|nr:transposase [Sandaracinaceae bacterium LLY-WYZ-13_1]